MNALVSSKVVIRELHKSLAEIGFRKSTPQTSCLQIVPEIFGWVGFNVAKNTDGSLEVGPMVGVHSVRMHALIAELRAEKYVRCNPPTIVQNVGYLMPDRKTYIAVKFDAPDLIAERAAIFCDLISKVGMPFMKQHADCAKIKESLTVFRSPSGYEERACVAEYLIGKISEARRLAAAHRDHLKSEHALLQADFEKFAVPFMQLLDAKTG